MMVVESKFLFPNIYSQRPFIPSQAVQPPPNYYLILLIALANAQLGLLKLLLNVLLPKEEVEVNIPQQGRGPAPKWKCSNRKCLRHWCNQYCTARQTIKQLK